MGKDEEKRTDITDIGKVLLKALRDRTDVKDPWTREGSLVNKTERFGLNIQMHGYIYCIKMKNSQICLFWTEKFRSLYAISNEYVKSIIRFPHLS